MGAVLRLVGRGQDLTMDVARNYSPKKMTNQDAGIAALAYACRKLRKECSLHNRDILLQTDSYAAITFYAHPKKTSPSNPLLKHCVNDVMAVSTSGVKNIYIMLLPSTSSCSEALCGGCPDHSTARLNAGRLISVRPPTKWKRSPRASSSWIRKKFSNRELWEAIHSEYIKNTKG